MVPGVGYGDAASGQPRTCAELGVRRNSMANPQGIKQWLDKANRGVHGRAQRSSPPLGRWQAEASGRSGSIGSTGWFWRGAYRRADTSVCEF